MMLDHLPSSDSPELQWLSACDSSRTPDILKASGKLLLLFALESSSSEFDLAALGLSEKNHHGLGNVISGF